MSFKDIKGKLRWSLLNIKALEGIVRVREYGTDKYHGEPDGWKKVDPQFYKDALMRHLAEMNELGWTSRDEESGLPNIWHVGCNVYFLLWFYMKGMLND